MKVSRIILAFAVCLILGVSCQDKEKEDSKKPIAEGLILNEIAPHEDSEGFDTWVEILNTTKETISLEGLSLFITDTYFKGQSIATLSGSLAAGERKVLSVDDGTLRTGIASNAAFTLVLGSSNDNHTDSFERKDDDPSLGYFGSWQRIPDASGEWRRVTYSSRGSENKLFDAANYRPTAVWAWGSHLSDLTADNGAKMRDLKRKGYDHILMNFAGFENKNYRQQAINFINLCEEIDLVPHVWLQCFYQNGSWVSPIDDTSKTYKEELFELIRNDARRYVETWGVKGVHLDYIRFGGTASKHNWTTEVNSVAAVNRCCREIRETTDSFEEGLLTSAALMPEANSSQYYGQKPAEMAKYIHILMPMNYRYGSYNMTDDTFKGNSNYYSDQAAKSGGVCWTGIQTYDSATKGMTAEALRKDIDLIAETRAAGVVLFRYQLGDFPDINDLWK